MTKIGYAQVSTSDQDYDGQIAKLEAEDCEIIRSEKVSGVSLKDRQELKTIIEFLRQGSSSPTEVVRPIVRNYPLILWTSLDQAVFRTITH
ncbi:MAG: recombinase family protein [Rhizobiaceae bacterium]|nr:recombinase family protein [Rhizobiaceae bacterium]